MELSYIAERKLKGYNYFGKQFGCVYVYTDTIWPSYFTLRHLPSIYVNTCPHEKFFIDILATSFTVIKRKTNAHQQMNR